MNPRKSKRRDLLLSVRELLRDAHERLKERDAAQAKALTDGPLGDGDAEQTADSPMAPSAAGTGALITPAANALPMGDSMLSAVTSGGSSPDDSAAPLTASGRASRAASEGMKLAVGAARASPVPLPTSSPAPPPAAVAVPVSTPAAPVAAAIRQPVPKLLKPVSALPPALTGGKAPRGGAQGLRLNLENSPAEHSSMKKRRVGPADEAAPTAPVAPEQSAFSFLSAALAEMSEEQAEGEADGEAAPIPRPFGPESLERALESRAMQAVQLSIDSRELQYSAHGLAGWLLPPTRGGYPLTHSQAPVGYARLLQAAGKDMHPYSISIVGTPDASLTVPGWVSVQGQGGSQASLHAPVHVRAYRSMAHVQAVAQQALDAGHLDKASRAAAGLYGGVHSLPSVLDQAGQGGVSSHLLEECSTPTLQQQVLVQYSQHDASVSAQSMGVHPVCSVLYMSPLSHHASCLAPCPDMVLQTASTAIRAKLMEYLRGEEGAPTSILQAASAAAVATASSPMSHIPAHLYSESDTVAVRKGLAPFLSHLQGLLGGMVLKRDASVPLLVVLPRATAAPSVLHACCASVAASFHAEVSPHLQQAQASGQATAALAALQKRLAGVTAHSGAALRPLVAAECGRTWAANLGKMLSLRRFPTALGYSVRADLQGVHVVTGPDAPTVPGFAAESQHSQSALPLEYVLLRIRLEACP